MNAAAKFSTIYVAGFVTDGGIGGFEWNSERAEVETIRARWVDEGSADLSPIRAVEVPPEDGVSVEAVTIWLNANSELWEPEYGEGRPEPGKGAEDLIAIERAALMEDAGMCAVAEDVREHKIALSTILARLAVIPDTTEARGLLGHWIEVDEGRVIPAEVRAFELIEADHIQRGDWIALDEGDAPGSEPRKVRSIQHRAASGRFASDYVECEFEDTDPGASFSAAEGVWRRERDPEPVDEDAEDLHDQIGESADCEQTAHRDDMPEDEEEDGACPNCGSTNLCQQTATHDRPPWACLDCDAEFEVPKRIEPAYTVFGIYLEDNGPHDGGGEQFQNYATSVYTFGGPTAAAKLAQQVCREDNDAETGDDLLQIVGVIAGEHNVLL